MGICSSCLGGRRPSESEQSDTSHLLGDQYQPNYGTANSAHNVPQPDPEELRRQRETLERICAETSEQLIPVSQPNLIPEVTEHPPKNDEYAHLFNERFRSIRTRPTSATSDNDEDETSWLEGALGNHDGDELDQITPAKGKLTLEFGAQ
ncbi:late endosomal/lysosomal adaptor and MAPK and MTOR activator-domain-containing protein [Pyrenochaeta sp. MPI-SDFR-AT-0127]|nr:late endosomal/lysosomal adaptor and MAPK and MTOR activator-domain-containing protein [Pyrenochaeta sp. MPI-SDFR-AT-0127]